MALLTNRLGGSHVAAGTIVACAISATIVVLGAALATSMGGPTLEILAERSGGVAAWLVASLAAGSYFGARTAAVFARTGDRRQGALGGLLVWATLTLVVLAVSAVWIGAAPVAASSLAPELGRGLFTLFIAQLASLGTALFGGIRRTAPKTRAATAATSQPYATYEQDFFGSTLSTPAPTP